MDVEQVLMLCKLLHQLRHVRRAESCHLFGAGSLFRVKFSYRANKVGTHLLILVQSSGTTLRSLFFTSTKYYRVREDVLKPHSGCMRESMLVLETTSVEEITEVVSCESVEILQN